MRSHELHEAIEAGICDPGAWAVALAGIARRLGAGAAGLSTRGAAACDYRLQASTGMDPALYPVLRRHAPRTQLWETMLRGRRAVSDRTALDRGVFLRSRFYREWFRPHGFDGVMLAPVLVDGCQSTALCAMAPRGRAFGRRELRMFERIAGRFAHAMEVQRRLEADRLVARLLLEAADARSEAVFLLDGGLRVHAANEAARLRLAEGDGLATRNGRLVLADPEAQRAVERTVAEAALDGASRRLCLALRLPAKRPVLLELLVCSGELSARLDLPRVLLRLQDPDLVPVPDDRILRSLFGLTDRQARTVTSVLVWNDRVRAAAALGIAPSTLRKHLEDVFVKMGVEDERGMRTLLASYGLPLPPPED